MRTHVFLLAALAAASFTTSAQNTGNPAATPGAQPPVRQQTVRPNDPASRAEETKNNTNKAIQRDRVPPASRGVGTSGSRPDCSKMRGIEKAECERRDTARDDLPAGVTTTQPENKE
jgi:hypothetical protein